MATVAIDPTEVRHDPPPPAAPSRRPSRVALIIAGAALGVAGLVAGAAAILSNVSLPSSLSGLAFLPQPQAPRRSEIRIGKLPEMPEIRNGVPEIVGTKPVRVIPAATATGPSSIPVGPAGALPTAPLPAAFNASTSGPGSAERPPVTSLQSATAPVVPPRPAAPTAGAPDVAAVFAAAAAPPAAPSLAAKPVERAAPRSETAAPAQPEPSTTASVPSAATAALHPMPPPAPARTALRAPEIKPEVRPERTPRPTQVAARPSPTSPGGAAPAGEPAPPQASSPEDRYEILGVKIPNGRDLKDAVSSVGEALNLPKIF